MLGLNKVEFSTYQGAIKRFGYRIDLTNEHLKSIAHEINLDYDAFAKDATSIYFLAYRN